MNEPAWPNDALRILNSGLFNQTHYTKQAQLSGSDPLRAVQHYLEKGEDAGLSPNPLFIPSWYTRRWDVPHALLDYLARSSERDPHILFDTAFYMGQGVSLAEGETPLAHYIRAGWHLGFDPHPLFSVAYYIKENADVASLGYEPLEHFVTHGWRENRRPCPEFDLAYYTNHYQDVAQTGVNPLLHYVTYGGPELRNPSAEFDAAWYGAQLRAMDHGSTVNPLAHYRTIGKAAGRLPARARWGLSNLGMLAAADAKIWAQNAFLQVAPMAVRRRAVATVTLGEPIANLPAEGLVFFLQAGDVPHSEAHAAVAGTSGLLTTFDAIARDVDGSVLPLLLPGANPLLLQNCSTLPPFCLDAAFCLEHPPPSDQDSATIRAWFRNLVQEAAGAGSLRHLPVPVVEVPLPRHHPPDSVQLPDVARIARAVVAQARAPVKDVSVVISTKDAGHLLVQLVLGILQPALPQIREVVLVINRPVNAFARSYHAQLRGIDRLKIIDYDKPYNFSDQANVGVSVTSGEFVLMLNDDIVPLGRQWLMHMLVPFDRLEVSICGPLLLYPDETVQHAGMFLGFNNVAGHSLRGARLPDSGTAARLTPQNCSAVTGAVMLVRRTAWNALAGFDTQLATYLQDVDFCLRAQRMGWEIAFTPDAILLHMESVSAKSTLRDPAMLERRGREHNRFIKRWGDAIYNDQFHSPHWCKQDETLRTIVALGPEIRDAAGG